MVVSHAANSDSFQVTTPSDQEIRLTRLFDAPRHLVFEAMTKPEHVMQWWGRLGEGYSVPVCEIDLRVGGRWRFVSRHPQGEAAFHGEYPGDHRSKPTRLHRNLRGLSGQRLGSNDGVHRRRRQDQNDCDRAVSVIGSARHGPRNRHVRRRGHQLRPPRRSRRRPTAVVTRSLIAQPLPYSSWRRHQTSVSLRPLGARSSHWYMPQRPSTPRA